MKKVIGLITLCVLFFSTNGAAQEKKQILVSGNFEGTLVELFQKIESQYDCYFYYDEKQLDSSTVKINAKDQPLEKVLAEALGTSGLQFSIDRNNRIFITKDVKLLIGLPSNLVTNNANQILQSDTIRDYGLELKKESKMVSSNKLYEIGTRTNMQKAAAIMTGYVRNAKTGEPLVNASVFVNTTYQTTTDAYGYYSLSLPPGKYTLNVVAIGMKDTHLQVQVNSDGKMDIEIYDQVTTLKEVIVSSRKSSNVTAVQMGVQRLNIDHIKRVPSLFGEADVLRVITSLPGVKTVGEASTGFNVRGGSADQNLILFNDANIFNPSHFFGMFSAFNPEVVKDIELYKSSVPARFGGRLSSVLDISSREGNKKNITGSAGIGLITSRVNIEGPLVKDKTSFIFGGRTSYANWLIGLLPDEYGKSRASFQDVNLGLSHRIDSTNNIYFTGYFSNDQFRLNSDTTYGYSNRNIAVKWKLNFNQKLNGTFITGIDQYEYRVFSDANKVNAFKLRFNIRQAHLKADFVYYKNQQHSFDFGASTIHYKLNPGEYTPRGDESLITSDIVEHEQALESGVYFTHRYNPNNRLSLSSGIRFSIFNYLGPNSINYYAPGLPVTETNLLETRQHKGGEFIKTYTGPELRLSARYAFNNEFSIKASYNTQRQYIHMLSNTTAIAPTDIWKLSDPNIRPQKGDQVSLGFYKNLKSNTIETSVEFYYRRIEDYLDYKPGAVLLLNHNIETDVVNTNGKAYGVEVLLKKPGGKLNGWISYTYSRILLRTSQPEQGAQVNKGEFYPANYDKPHDVTFTGTFRVNHRFSISLNSTYSTGRPITLPIGRYFYAGSERVLYSDRNAYRIPDYFRTDFSMNIDGNHKVNQKTHNSWTIGVYNMLGRKNPYSVYFVSENGFVNGYKLSIFGSAIPFINYNIRF